MNPIAPSVHENLDRSDKLWLETLLSELGATSRGTSGIADITGSTRSDSQRAHGSSCSETTSESTNSESRIPESRMVDRELGPSSASPDPSGTKNAPGVLPPPLDSQVQAIQKLTARLIQYGPTDPIAIPAARRLLPLLANPELSVRAQICSLLEGLCLAAAPSTSPRSASERRLARDFLELVSEHRGTLYKSLADSDLELRIAMPTFVAALADGQDEGLENVEQRLAIEDHRLVRASLIEAKSRLAWQCSAASLRNLALELSRCALHGLKAGIAAEPNQTSLDSTSKNLSTEPHDQHGPFGHDAASEAPITRVIAAVNLLVFEDYRPAAIELILELIESAEGDVLQLPWIQGESLLHFVRSGYDESPQLCLEWYQSFLDHPRYQSEALWGLADLALEWRAMAAPVAKLLVQAMSSASPDLRKRARYDVTRVGRAAIPLLEPLLESPNAEIRLAAADALRDIEAYQAEAAQQANFEDDFEAASDLRDANNSLEREANGQPVPADDSDPRRPPPHSLEKLRDLNASGSTWDRIEALKQLANSGPLGPHHYHPKKPSADPPRARAAAQAHKPDLDPISADAPSESSHLEEVYEALSDPIGWVRLHAARAFWLLGGDFDKALLTILGELRGRPSGFLALAILETMGPAAHHAERTLKALIESPRRVMELGEFYRTAHLDEQFVDRCKACLRRITPKRDRSRSVKSPSEKPPLKSFGRRWL